MVEKIVKYEDSVEMLRVLAHPVRLGLVETLLANGPTNVTAMYEELEMPQSTISQHLAKLKSARIVAGTRKGLEIYYEVIDDRVESIISSLA